MSDGDWTLRALEPADEAGFLDCLEAAFGAWPGVDIQVAPIEHLRWKMSSGPLAAGRQYVVTAGDQIVGGRVVVVKRVKVRDSVLLAAFFTDLAVRPDYQSRGVMRVLFDTSLQRAAETFDLVIGLSGHQGVQGRMDLRGLVGASNAVEALDRELSSHTAQPPPAASEGAALARFDERVDRLWEQASEHFEFAVVRTSGYLNWRYADPRAGRYTVRIVDDGSRLLGYAVLAVSRGKAFIADLLALPNRLDVIDTLIEDAVRHFAASELSSIRCWLPRDHPYREALLRCGFRPARPVQGLTFGQLGRTDLRFIAEDEHAALHITIGDTDIV